MYVVADFFISLQENFLFIWSNIKVTIIQEPSLWMIISYVIGMSGFSWPIAGSAVGMETVGVVRLLMIRRTIYPVFGIYWLFVRGLLLSYWMCRMRWKRGKSWCIGKGADWINVFLRWRRNIMGGRFMPVVVYFALGKSVHVDLVRLAATPCGFVVPLRPVGSIWDVLPRSCSV